MSKKPVLFLNLHSACPPNVHTAIGASLERLFKWMETGIEPSPLLSRRDFRLHVHTPAITRTERLNTTRDTEIWDSAVARLAHCWAGMGRHTSTMAAMSMSGPPTWRSSRRHEGHDHHQDAGTEDDHEAPCCRPPTGCSGQQDGTANENWSMSTSTAVVLDCAHISERTDLTNKL